MNSTTLSIQLRRTIGIAFLLSSAQLVCAQETAPPSAAAASDNETVVLSPFVVNTTRDEGYQASSSLSGGRLNTSLKDTAASVSVLTRELLDDLAANNFQDAAEWSVSSTSRYLDEANPFNDYGVNFRNLSFGYNSRNFFRWYVNSDSFMSERYDLARGPNSIVFGDAGIGGTINVTSKRARLGRTFTELQARTRSAGGYRFGIDHNQPIGDKAAIRAVLVRQRFDEWMDRTSTNFEGVLLTGEWRPFRKTTIWGEFEYGNQQRVITNQPRDQFSRWDGVTGVSAAQTTNFTGGISRVTTDRNVYVPANGALGVNNWRNWGSTAGTGIRLAPTAWPIIPTTSGVSTVIPDFAYNFSPSNAFAGNRHKSYSLFLEQQFGDNLFAEVAFNYFNQRRQVNNFFFAQNMQVDVNRNLPNGKPNPYFGQNYVDASVQPQLQAHDQWEARANLAYLFAVPFADFRALVGYTERNDLFKVKRFKWNMDTSISGNPDIDASINQLTIRRYASELDSLLDYPVGAEYVERAEGGITNRTGIWRSAQAALSGKWFSGRKLSTLLGVRRDNVLNDVRLRTANPVTKRFAGWEPETRIMDVTVTNWSASAIYQVTDSFGLYASYADSYDFPNTATAIDRRAIPPITSKGIEAGLRFSLLNGKINGSLAYYQSEQINRRESGVQTEINRIWEALTGEVDKILSYSDVSSWEGSGVEFEVVANPTDSFRMTFNVALPDAKQGAGYLDTKAYFETNLPTWQGLIATQTDPAKVATANTNISTIRNRFEGFTVGRKLNNSWDYTANILGNYTFREGTLKGLSLGGGANLRGKRLVGNQLGAPYDYIYNDPYVTATILAGYSFKVLGNSLRLQLNVANLFDNREMQSTSGGFANVTIPASGTTPASTTFTQNNYTVLAPRTYTLSVTYKF